MHILLYAFLVDIIYVKTVLGLQIEHRFQVDLIDALHVYNNTYDGLTLLTYKPPDSTPGLSPAIQLKGDNRRIQLPEDTYQRATKLLSSNDEFTLLATLQQEDKNAGSIIAFSEGNNRFLELQSSARKNEIRLHYTHHDNVYVETFPYRLADGQWHRLAVSISGNMVKVLVDCNQIYERVIKDVDRTFQSRNLSLWLGQRNSKHFLFKGSLQDVKIVATEHGYLTQCPHLNTECPTCGQHRQLQSSVAYMENYMKGLAERVNQLEEQVARLSQCECQKSCHDNGISHADGAAWKQGCDICTCTKGEIVCKPIKCPPTPCKNPIQNEGDCCPTCLKQCLLKGVLYDHGEQVSPRECIDCACQDGTMHCEKMNPSKQCPTLTCPEEEQFGVPGECCKFCPGVDYCTQGHKCHVNATCVNMRTGYTCQCNEGFEGDGHQCHDVDECANEGGHNGHHCQKNTVCVNGWGSYSCECVSGYVRVDAFNCAEHDECRSGAHQCHSDATCINTAGSYHCRCNFGYQGDGFNCEPVCNQTCLNGGQCVAPATCNCRRGYVGPRCEIDVDECSLGIHQCHPYSQCVNLPGWYYCECKDGYYSYVQDNNLGLLCQDVNECEDGSHTCHGSAKCLNINGGFQCQCHNLSSCSLNCIHDGIERKNGSTWPLQGSSCTDCQCLNGIASCERYPCDCSDPRVNLDCCPHCDRTSKCQHQEHNTLYENGQRWIYQCQQCECLYGEIDCWPVECPVPNCDNPTIKEGDCCPRCEDDPCTIPPTNTSISSTAVSNLSQRGCTYQGRTYQHGDNWATSQDLCTICRCQHGHLCCSFSTTCTHNFTLATTSASSLQSGVGVTMRNGISGVYYTKSGRQLPDDQSTSSLYSLSSTSFGDRYSSTVTPATTTAFNYRNSLTTNVYESATSGHTSTLPTYTKSGTGTSKSSSISTQPQNQRLKKMATTNNDNEGSTSTSPSRPLQTTAKQPITTNTPLPTASKTPQRSNYRSAG
ncbi:NEL-like 2 (chicken) [Chamberlinius hualienensis]